MNLLPKSHEEFSQVDYWNTFFKKRGKKSFEWYGEYPELCSYLLKYVKVADDLLVVGCGNSTLSMSLYDAGYKSITNIDISKIVIKQMQDLNKSKRDDMIFEQMDATHMSYPEERFNVVLDKGTLDALSPDNSEETGKTVDKYFAEITRVLRNGGRYICISLLQDCVLRKLLSYFPSSGFMFRVLRCYEAEIKSMEEDGSCMPVFIVIATKCVNLKMQILELALTAAAPERVTSTDAIVEAITSSQNAALISNRLHKSNTNDTQEVSLDLYRPGDTKPRYTFYILNQPRTRETTPYAAFIVPQGRETDWLFSTKEGRQEIHKTTKKERLVIVVMRRDHKFENLEEVKAELETSVKQFAPKRELKDIPYLSLGADVGQRTICFEGNSDISGSFVIEDVEIDGHTHRRLVFLSNEFLTQSEARLKSVKSRRGKMKIAVDPGYLACEHHSYMSIGVTLSLEARPQTRQEIAVVGLGGGSLCTFLYKCFPKLNIVAVDIDKAILDAATRFFDLIVDNRMQVKIMDGLKYIEDCAQQNITFDSVLFDVNSSDTSLAIRCPPKEFLSLTVLKQTRKCLKNNGVFVLNLVCRDEEVRQGVMKDLKSVFESVTVCKLERDVNQVILCTVNKEIDMKKKIKLAAANINEEAKSKNLVKEDVVDVTSLMKDLYVEL